MSNHIKKKEDQSVQIACRVPRSMKKWIKKEAKIQGISEAELVRIIIMTFINNETV